MEALMNKDIDKMNRIQIKNQQNCLKMMCVTYNMKGLLFGTTHKPMRQLDDLFQRDNVYHDIYAFATQEAERSIVGSLMNENKDKLIAQLREYFQMTDQRTTLAE